MTFAIATVNAGTWRRYIEDDYNNVEGQECWSNGDVNISSMTVGWYQRMQEHSYSGSSYIDSPTRRWLADNDKVSWGRDYLHIDIYDIVLLGGHGNCRDYNGIYQYALYMNEEYEGACRVYPGEIMDLGESADEDIEILHVISCHSMDVALVGSSCHSNTWQSVFGGIHQVQGFAGSTWSNSNLMDDYSRLGDDGFSNSVAGEWVNELYEEDFVGVYDNCPVAYTGRNSSTAATNLLTYEQYDTRSNYSDINDP